MSETPSHAVPPIQPDTAPVPPPPPAPVRTGLATAALVLGILAIPTTVICVGPLLGLLAVILGIIAVVRAGSQPQLHGGMARGVTGIALGALSIVLFPLALSVLLPSVARARQLAFRAVSAANLRGIGQAVYIYADRNAGAPPPDLHTFIGEDLCVPDQLISPSSGHVPPACDYFYVYYAVLPDYKQEPDWILAYSDPAHHAGEGGNILYIDGRVEFVLEPDFTQQIESFSASYESRHGRPPTIIPPG